MIDLVVRAVVFESYFAWRLILSMIEILATNVSLLDEVTPPLTLPFVFRSVFYLSCECQRGCPGPLAYAI
jgi:hypothetical protein